MDYPELFDKLKEPSYFDKSFEMVIGDRQEDYFGELEQRANVTTGQLSAVKKQVSMLAKDKLEPPSRENSAEKSAAKEEIINKLKEAQSKNQGQNIRSRVRNFVRAQRYRTVSQNVLKFHKDMIQSIDIMNRAHESREVLNEIKKRFSNEPPE